MRRITLTEHQQEALEAIHARHPGVPRPNPKPGKATGAGNRAVADRALSARAAKAYLSWLRKTRGR